EPDAVSVTGQSASCGVTVVTVSVAVLWSDEATLADSDRTCQASANIPRTNSGARTNRRIRRHDRCGVSADGDAPANCAFSASFILTTSYRRQRQTRGRSPSSRRPRPSWYDESPRPMLLPDRAQPRSRFPVLGEADGAMPRARTRRSNRRGDAPRSLAAY